MASTNAISNMRSSIPMGKHSFLPPKCPIPVLSPFCGDYGSLSSRSMPKPRDGQKCHQRTSSESFLIDEQPSWLDDLLNEPEIQTSRGAHRRSSSDCIPYLDGSVLHSNLDSLDQEDCRQMRMPARIPWGPQEFDGSSDANLVQYLRDAALKGIPQNRGWEFATMNNARFPHNVPLVKDNTRGTCFTSANASPVISDVTESKERQEPNQDPTGSSEQKDNVQSKQSDLDPKRAKQQFAQRSRVRKLQYIAELERNAHILQAEGLDFAAELDFLDKQNMILNLENKTLKQRLDSLAQEQLIKRFQQEMLEQEICRLRMLYQQQQQQQHQQQQPHIPTNPTHGRSGSRDLKNIQFASLSLKQKDSNSGPVRS